MIRLDTVHAKLRAALPQALSLCRAWAVAAVLLRRWPRIRHLHGKQLAAVILLTVGLVVQVVLTALLFHLVDLTVSLMEVWVELARKHLEITLAPPVK